MGHPSGSFPRLPPSLPASTLPARCQHIASALQNAAHLLCGCSWRRDLGEERELKLSSEEDERPASNAAFSFVSFFLIFSFQAALSFQGPGPHHTTSTSAFSRR